MELSIEPLGGDLIIHNDSVDVSDDDMFTTWPHTLIHNHRLRPG